MTADVRELVRLAVAFERSIPEAERAMVAAVTRGAFNIKRDWQDNARTSAGRHARLYPGSISYDVDPIPGGATAEIGPDKDKPQGALGNLLEFGSVNNSPHNDGGRALQAEDPRFTAQVAAITERLGTL